MKHRLSFMLRFIAIVSCGLYLFAISACQLSAAQTFDQASQHYKQHRDYASLKIISQSLKVGMDQGRVVSLLGEPDYAPTEGLYFYSSDRVVQDNVSGNDITYGLIVDYRLHEQHTSMLQKFTLGPIAE